MLEGFSRFDSWLGLLTCGSSPSSAFPIFVIRHWLFVKRKNWKSSQLPRDD